MYYKRCRMWKYVIHDKASIAGHFEAEIGYIKLIIKRKGKESV